MLLMRWLLAPPRLWVRDETAATLPTQACLQRWVLVPELWPYWRESATPRVQVLDETFDGLDEASRGALRGELAARLDGAEWSRRALMLITHHAEELFGRQGGGGGGAECEEQVLAPTHALLLGQGEGGTAWHAGPWEAMAPRLAGYFDAQREKQWVMPSSPPPRRAQAAAGASAVAGGTAAVAAGEALIDFRNLRVAYGSHVVFDGGLSWLVREGEKWVVHGGNGTGKSTLVELITGDNVLGYAQEHLHLFGRQKGSGESVWQIRALLGTAAWPRAIRPAVARAATTAPGATRCLGATLLAREPPPDAWTPTGGCSGTLVPAQGRPISPTFEHSRRALDRVPHAVHRLCRPDRAPPAALRLQAASARTQPVALPCTSHAPPMHLSHLRCARPSASPSSSRRGRSCALASSTRSASTPRSTSTSAA